LTRHERGPFRFRPLNPAEPSRFPEVGALILVNCIAGAAHLGSLRLPFKLTAFTPSSRTKTEWEMTNSPHVCIVVSVTRNADDWILMVFPTRSYSESNDSVQYVADVPGLSRVFLIESRPVVKRVCTDHPPHFRFVIAVST
jgi:hypothetical protein